jgi:hypothetical protein
MCTLHLAAQIATRLQTHQRRSPIAATPHGSMSGISLAKHDDGGVCISPCSIGLLSFHTASREAPLGHVNTPRPSNLLLTNLRNRTKARRVCEFRIIDGKRGACVYVFVLCVINASAPMLFSLSTTAKCSSLLTGASEGCINRCWQRSCTDPTEHSNSRQSSVFELLAYHCWQKEQAELNAPSSVRPPAWKPHFTLSRHCISSPAPKVSSAAPCQRARALSDDSSASNSISVTSTAVSVPIVPAAAASRDIDRCTASFIPVSGGSDGGRA